VGGGRNPFVPSSEQPVHSWYDNYTFLKPGHAEVYGPKFYLNLSKVKSTKGRKPGTSDTKMRQQRKRRARARVDAGEGSGGAKKRQRRDREAVMHDQEVKAAMVNASEAPIPALHVD
jgi:hypothetical protein